MFGLGNFLSRSISHSPSTATHGSNNHKLATMGDVDPRLESITPWALGTYESAEIAKRERKDILTAWKIMQRDPTIAAALNLHITAALGGHESRGDTVFMVPSDNLGDGGRAKELRDVVTKEAKILSPMFNRIAFAMCRHALGYGDAYTRMYHKRGQGLLDLMCNEHTEAPLIQSFEQGSRTVGYHVLELDDYQKRITELNTIQMARMKMSRYAPIPQYRLERWLQQRILKEDDIEKLPIIASAVGGSILYDAEEPYKNVQLLLAAMNTQQIADSVKQTFLSADLSGMPKDHQKKYKAGLNQTLKSHSNAILQALMGGKTIWSNTYHIVPTWNNKQVLNVMNDIAQRGTPINPELLMINMRRLSATLGQDMSMLGWADMLSGGLGDGGFFHTSAQVMQKSIHIRQAFTDTLNHMANVHFGAKYGRMFHEHELPWQFDFYSDMSAGSTEALTNRQTRMNTLSLVAAALSAVKEIGLDELSAQLLLEDIGGLDAVQANKIAKSIMKAAQEGAETVGWNGDGNNEMTE